MTSTPHPPRPRGRLRRWLGRPSLLVTGVLILVALFAGRLTATTVESQDDRLLQERANEVSLVLTASVTSVGSGLASIGSVLRVTDVDIAFDRASQLALAGVPTASVAHAAPRGDDFVVLRSKGAGLSEGQLLTGPRADAMRTALTTRGLVSTHVLGSGHQRSIGFAVGPPAAPAGTVVYRETALGPLSPPRAAGTAPFSEIKVALYSGTRADPAMAVVATAGVVDELPLRGDVVTQPLKFGAIDWTLQVAAKEPMVGELAAAAGWIVAGAGIVIALLVGLVIESAVRRRDSALALYNSEHRLAENLQRSFLPELPSVAGLEIAARYLTGSADQQVGGDWYDVFVTDDDETGLVIGDVLGHDVGAAVVMSRIQTALRAYACRGDEPAEVLDVLDRHLRNIQADLLTTVFYGVLGNPEADGSRVLRFANAGHLHPVVRYPDGRVDELVTSRSVVLGVPGGFGDGRTQAEVRLPAGSVLVLFTDGLVEVPEISLTDSIEAMKDTARSAAPDAGPDEICARLTDGMSPGSLRDDVAVLAVKVTGCAPTDRADETVTTGTA